MRKRGKHDNVCQRLGIEWTGRKDNPKLEFPLSILENISQYRSTNRIQKSIRRGEYKQDEGTEYSPHYISNIYKSSGLQALEYSVIDKLSNMDNRWKHALSTKFLSQLQNKTKQNIFDHSDNDFGLSICKSIKAFLTDLRKKVKGPIKSQLSKATKTVIMACTYKNKSSNNKFCKNLGISWRRLRKHREFVEDIEDDDEGNNDIMNDNQNESDSDGEL